MLPRGRSFAPKLGSKKPRREAHFRHTPSPISIISIHSSFVTLRRRSIRNRNVMHIIMHAFHFIGCDDVVTTMKIMRGRLSRLVGRCSRTSDSCYEIAGGIVLDVCVSSIDHLTLDGNSSDIPPHHSSAIGMLYYFLETPNWVLNTFEC
jgi:hypothetical protein